MHRAKESSPTIRGQRARSASWSRRPKSIGRSKSPDWQQSWGEEGPLLRIGDTRRRISLPRPTPSELQYNKRKWAEGKGEDGVHGTDSKHSAHFTFVVFTAFCVSSLPCQCGLPSHDTPHPGRPHPDNVAPFPPCLCGLASEPTTHMSLAACRARILSVA